MTKAKYKFRIEKMIRSFGPNICTMKSDSFAKQTDAMKSLGNQVRLIFEKCLCTYSNILFLCI